MKKLYFLCGLLALGLASLFLLEDRVAPAAGPQEGIDVSSARWTSDRNTALLSGQVDSVGREFSPLWEVNLRGGVYSGGVMVDSQLYLADEMGYLSCLNLVDGSLVWEHKLDAPVFSPLLWVEGVLYFGDTHGRFSAFDCATQRILWSYSSNKEKISGGTALSTDGASLYFGSYDFTFRGLNRADGQELFVLKTGNYINGTAALLGDSLVFGGCDSYLRVVDGCSGEQLRKIKLGSYIPSSIASDGQNVYATCYNGRVRAVSAEGQELWEYRPPKGKGSISYQTSPSVNSRYVVAAEQNGVVNILEKDSGTLKSQVLLVGDIDTSPLVDENYALIPDNKGTVYVIDLEQASIVKEYKYGTVISAPLMLDKGLLILCDENGTVSAFHLHR